MVTLLDTLVENVMDRRPRRYVDSLMCHGYGGCGECFWCLDGQKGTFILGTNRMVDVTHGTKKSVVVADEIGVQEEELARPWLEHCFTPLDDTGMASRRVPWMKSALDHLELLPPRYFAGGDQTGEWGYVDIVQAYPSIYSRMTLDCFWRPYDDRPILGQGACSLRSAVELFEAKQLHRAAGGVIRSTMMTKYVNGRPKTVSTVGWSKFLAPDLWGVIQWTLHAIARMAIQEFGCVMWDTDGGVVPLERAGALVSAISERWRLGSRIDHQGPGTIWGVKHWDIGPDSTKQGGERRVLDADSRVLQPSNNVVRCLQEAMA